MDNMSDEQAARKVVIPIVLCREFAQSLSHVAGLCLAETWNVELPEGGGVLSGSNVVDAIQSTLNTLETRSHIVSNDKKYVNMKDIAGVHRSR